MIRVTEQYRKVIGKSVYNFEPQTGRAWWEDLDGMFLSYTEIQPSHIDKFTTRMEKRDALADQKTGTND